MSTNFNEFCCSLVEETFGGLYARLYSQLAYHGRLSAPQLAQRTSLSPKQIRAGLSVLVQYKLIYHHTSSDGTSTYQVCSQAAYNLLRTGRLVELAKSKLGSLAASVIEEVTQLGFATISELEETTLESLSRSRIKMTNGIADGSTSKATLLKKVREAIHSLLREGFLHQVRPAHFQAHFDAQQDAEMHLKTQGALTSAKGKKGQVEHEMMIENELQRRMNSDVPEHGNTRKRSLEGVEHQPTSKRQRVGDKKSSKLNGSTATIAVQDRSDSSVLVCAYFQNVVSKIRNDLVARKAKKCLGLVPARVMEALLSSVPSSEPERKDENESQHSHQLSLEDVHNEATRSSSHVATNGNHHTNGDIANGIHDEDIANYDEDDLSFGEVDHTLALLAHSEFSFLNGKLREDQWKVNKKELKEYVQRQESLRMMGDRLGPTALRVVRMLMEKGKLDEKNLQELGLMGAKDLRQTLAQLKQMGYIDLQEVPREAQRQPNRTIFLWFYDSRRTQKILLESLYKAMSRLMQRLQFEKAKLSSTLEKIERSDVQGQEESAMSEAELRVLKRWYQKQQWLLGELCRLDNSVALLGGQ